MKMRTIPVNSGQIQEIWEFKVKYIGSYFKKIYFQIAIFYF